MGRAVESGARPTRGVREPAGIKQNDTWSYEAMRHGGSLSREPFKVDASLCVTAMSVPAEADDMGKGQRRASGNFRSLTGAGFANANPRVAPATESSDDLNEVLRQIGGGRSPDLSEDARADLLSTIHDRIIPQLMLAHRAEVAEPACSDARMPPTEAEVSEFAQIAVSEDMGQALAFIENLASEGMSLEVVLLQLVASAARLLGEQWMADLRPFTDVTAALGLLQRVVHVLGPSFAAGVSNRGTVIITAAPHEQHTLGAYLLAEFLRRAGWGVQVDPTMSDAELLATLRVQRVEMVAISVSNTELLEPVARRVAAIRRESANRRIAIMVGGSSQLADKVGAFGATFCNDPRDAVRWLEHHAQADLPSHGS